MLIIIHIKFTNLANAPDEIFKLQKKYENDKVKFYFVYKDKNLLNKILLNHKNDNIILHFHNIKFDIDPIFKNLKIKKIIHYHSEPSNKVDLKVDPSYKRLTLNQYHCLLQEYKNCIPVRNFFVYDSKIIFNSKIKIGFYPSIIEAKNKYYDKGYVETVPILNKIKEKFGDNIIVEIAYGIPYNECINKKKDCHIVIDECKTGSFHKSSLEGLVLGCIVLVNISDSLNKKHIELYSQELPIINTKLNYLENKLIELINLGKQKLEEIAITNNKKFLNYWNENIIFEEYKKIYENLFSLS